ncbi:MAG: hypothetical protein ACO3PD_01560 [Acidimicrobiales bacterium]
MPESMLRTAWWWFVTFVTLVVIDDLTYGPIYWALGAFIGPVAAVIAFVVYVVAQLFLINRGVRDEPGRIARWLLDRLMLTRKEAEVAKREAVLHERVTGVVLAMMLAPIIGGVLPALLLHKRGWSQGAVTRVGMVTSVIYAVEFSLLHAYIPSQIL